MAKISIDHFIRKAMVKHIRDNFQVAITQQSVQVISSTYILGNTKAFVSIDNDEFPEVDAGLYEVIAFSTESGPYKVWINDYVERDRSNYILAEDGKTVLDEE